MRFGAAHALACEKERADRDQKARNWRARKRQEQLALARFSLREEMDKLLKLADVGLRIEWQRATRSNGLRQPARWVVRVRYGHWLNLFGALVLQLPAEDVCQSDKEPQREADRRRLIDRARRVAMQSASRMSSRQGFPMVALSELRRIRVGTQRRLGGGIRGRKNASGGCLFGSSPTAPAGTARSP